VHLHIRLTPNFLPLVLAPLTAALAPAPASKDGEKDDKERIARQRVILRIVAELGLISAWPEGIKKGAGEVGKILQTLVSCVDPLNPMTLLNAQMSNDPQYNNLPLPTTFLRSFGRTYLGPAPNTQEALADGVEELVPTEIQAKMRQLFVGYFEGASKTLIKGQHVSLDSTSSAADLIEIAGTGQAEPRGVHQVRRDLRRPTTSL
jgi:regulator of nonsense transcripts 2